MHQSPDPGNFVRNVIDFEEIITASNILHVRSLSDDCSANTVGSGTFRPESISSPRRFSPGRFAPKFQCGEGVGALM